MNDVAAKVAELPNPDSKIYPLGLDFGVDGNRIAVESQSGKIHIRCQQSFDAFYQYDHGDAIHLAGNTHLGGLGNLALLAAGPNTAALSVLAPGAAAAGGVSIASLLATALYDIVGPAYSINTIIPDIRAMGADSATGAFNWPSASTPSQVPRTSGNPSLPFYSISNGNLLVTDPKQVLRFFCLALLSRCATWITGRVRRLDIPEKIPCLNVKRPNGLRDVSNQEAQLCASPWLLA